VDFAICDFLLLSICFDLLFLALVDAFNPTPHFPLSTHTHACTAFTKEKQIQKRLFLALNEINDFPILAPLCSFSNLLQFGFVRSLTFNTWFVTFGCLRD
jgi:hypothetical protein